MGMSASQARLIQLTARMSDTEYEGQQINQQRLTLANQMNAVYESMANMDVPTPPSKLDPKYKKKVYSDKSGMHKIKQNDDGTVSYYNVIKNGSILQNNDRKLVTSIKQPENCVNTSKTYTKANFEKLDKSNMTEMVTADIEVDTGAVDDYDYPITASLQASGTRAEIQALAPGSKYLDYKVKSGPTNIQTTGYRAADGEVYSEKEIEAHNKNIDEQLSKKKFAKADSYEIVDGKSLADGVEYYEVTDEKGLRNYLDAKENGQTTGTTVGGMRIIEFGDENYKNSQSYANAIQALQHSFPENSQDDFYLLVDKNDKGDTVFGFAKKEDVDGNAGKDNYAYLYTVTNGSYEAKVGDLSPDQITYDTNGNISEVVIDGQSMLVSLGDDVFDEAAYDADMAKYNSDKAVYDEEQDRLNKQTSIYQRQDKMLELKLTRLDNERNSLNTEIEAVKKVIQDAIDRGFKTFSG